jgi:hypothetical protein
MLCASLAVQVVLAETVVVDDKVMVRDSSVPHPKRGMRMTQVEQKFGAPTTRHAAVGQPPITRWDYPAFAVFFEHDIVIHAVVLGEPTPAAAGADSAAPAPESPPAQTPAGATADSTTPPQ